MGRRTVVAAIVVAALACAVMFRSAGKRVGRPAEAEAGAETSDPAPSPLDRAKANRDRERFRASEAARSLLQGSPHQTQAPGPSPLFTAPVTPAPPLDGQRMGESLNAQFMPMARECYRNAVAKAPDSLVGQIEMRFEITPDESIGGLVDEATLTEGTTIEDHFLRMCLTESMMTVSFAAVPPPGGLPVALSLTYPLGPPLGDEDAG
jgi:hypothetical protein